nr:putative reverse transcriptase domain-containing protein [Tanacetum cinerariifolium]
STNDTTTNTVAVPSAGDRPVLSSSVDHTVEKVIDYGNNKGTQDGNVRQSPISSTSGLNIVIFQINISDSHTTDPNNSSPSLSGPTPYAKLVTGEPSRKNVNFRTLLGPAGNRADVAISLESVRAISECLLILSMGSFCEDGLSDIATKRVALLMLDYYTSDMCMKSWGKSRYARAMIELRADVELKDTIVVAMPKLVFGHAPDECPKNIISDVEKNLKNPIQDVRGVQVGQNMALKLIKQVYRHVSNRNNVSSSGKKKQAVVASKEVGNSNPFDVLNSVEKDDDLSTNGKGIKKRQSDGKRTLMDDDGKPLPKVVSTVNVNSDSEVEDVIDDHEVFMKSTGLKRGADSRYGNNNLLEQWRTTKQDDNYDPDDDLFESHEMSENLQAIYDELDITVRGSSKALFDHHVTSVKGLSPKNSGNGNNILFWKDIWLCSGIRLKDKFSHLYALETIKDALLSERWCCFNGVWAGLWLWIINPRGRSKSDLKLLISYLQGFELRVGAEDRLVVCKTHMKLKEARTRQKSYADKHRRSLEFQPGDHVFLKVSPARGVRRFGIKDKLNPRFIGPFEILDRVGEVSYRLALPPQLSHVHDVFHVSLLRGYKYHPLHNHEEKDYSVCQDSLEEPSRAGSHLGNRRVYPDFLSSFPSMI